MSTGYPRNLSYFVRKLANYSRNTFRLQTLNQDTASANQIITVDLPNNALVDLVVVPSSLVTLKASLNVLNLRLMVNLLAVVALVTTIYGTSSLIPPLVRIALTDAGFCKTLLMFQTQPVLVPTTNLVNLLSPTGWVLLAQ